MASEYRSPELCNTKIDRMVAVAAAHIKGADVVSGMKPREQKLRQMLRYQFRQILEGKAGEA